MTNVKSEVKGDLLILTIDISKVAQAAAVESKSGKTKVLASTHGFTSINGVGVSLNCTIR